MSDELIKQAIKRLVERDPNPQVLIRNGQLEQKPLPCGTVLDALGNPVRSKQPTWESIGRATYATRDAEWRREMVGEFPAYDVNYNGGECFSREMLAKALVPDQTPTVDAYRRLAGRVNREMFAVVERDRQEQIAQAQQILAAQKARSEEGRLQREAWQKHMLETAHQDTPQTAEQLRTRPRWNYEVIP